MDDRELAARRWFLKAANDLYTAETMLRDAFPTPDTICFHAQQCMERLLKGILTVQGQDIEFTHDLPHLVTMCAQVDERFMGWMDVARELTDYAVEVRYPDVWREIPLDEAMRAAQLARQFRDFVWRFIRDMGGEKAREE
jgi:HEPN domain-containing protein